MRARTIGFVTGRPRASTVVVVGTVNLDLVFAVDRLPVPGETVTGGVYAELGGGKGANAAAAAALVARTHLVAAVGDDAAGRAALDELVTLGVDVTAVAVLAGIATGRAGIFTSATENSIVVAPGANHAMSADHVASVIGGIADRHAGGVCLVSAELDGELVDIALDTAEAQGMLPVFNGSPVRPFSDAVRRTRPVLVVNRLEAEQLSGVADPAAAAAELLQVCRAAVVTCGAEGVVAATNEGLVELAAHPATVVDTTGAGDAFTGGFAAALATSRQVTEALDAGLAAAARAVGHHGARTWIGQSRPA
jgi:ribokinase